MRRGLLASYSQQGEYGRSRTERGGMSRRKGDSVVNSTSSAHFQPPAETTVSDGYSFPSVSTHERMRKRRDLTMTFFLGLACKSMSLVGFGDHGSPAGAFLLPHPDMAT